MNLSFISINDILLVFLLGLALFFDLTRKKIPNFCTFPAIGAGLLYSAVSLGLDGFLSSLYGMLLGTALFLIPFAMGGMGGGDVKLLGAVGALQGWQFVLTAAFLTALSGGVMALVYLTVTGRLLHVLRKMLGSAAAPLFSALYRLMPLDFFYRTAVYFSPAGESGDIPVRLPYGVAIAAGTLGVLAWMAAGGELFPGGLLR